MRSLAITMVLLSGLVGAAAVSEAPLSDSKDSILVVSQDARTSNPGPATNFTGHAQVEQLFGAKDSSRPTGGIVTFEPGALSVWHTHPVGQILIVTAGSGLVQQWGSPVQTMKAGDVVWIPARVKHWHGASASSVVTHIAIQEMADGKVVDWLEPVTDTQYTSRAQTP
jgi:4-carboxymuconolactone decarboxylase